MAKVEILKGSKKGEIIKVNSAMVNSLQKTGAAKAVSGQKEKNDNERIKKGR
ncbi:hypothetical protein [Gluconacetobacter diazotrophicus]|uniref:hypothetical protein n=1 Tax=Gluconacetobacter diazotrophicus TaxID=33996 RepID=UPI0012FEF98B|nr:hypothetical protein [Gluconacetobacter diazotrophicus]